jgi:DNA polymerase-3 subunit gamma/tau
MSGNHLALYRKYRPQTFSDVVGQEQLVSLLERAISDKKVSHAYLFCGGRGTGKTTVARIFARDIGSNDEDIIEIDAASNRGIDEIRELRDAVRTSPFSSPYKVYIVDEAHMLTKEAANALLKTLEEPPAHVIFILATTDPEKLPATIVSRCQKVVFQVPSLLTLSERLIHVAKGEGKKLNEDTALLIAKHGKGSYRDALGYLEQVVSMCEGKEIQLNQVIEVIGQPEHALLISLLTAFSVGNEKKVIEYVEVLSKKSAAPRAYDEFLDLVRQALLARIGEAKDDSEVASLGKTYATVLNSALILSLLEKRHLITVSESHGWLAFESILISELPKAP